MPNEDLDCCFVVHCPCHFLSGGVKNVGTEQALVDPILPIVKEKEVDTLSMMVQQRPALDMEKKLDEL